MDQRDRLLAAITEVEQSAEKRGLEAGLRVAEVITGWLTIQPQTKRMAEIEGWARKAIDTARTARKIGVQPSCNQRGMSHD